METFLYLLLVVYGVAFYLKPRMIFAVLPLFFPLYLWKFELLGIPFNFTEAFIWISLGVWLLQILISKKIALNYKGLKPWIGLLSLLVIGASIAVFQGENVDLKLPLGIWKSWIIAPVVYFVMFKSFLPKREQKMQSFYAYLVSSVVLALWAIWQMYCGEFVTIDGRASGPFISANYLSLYIGPAILGAGILFWQNLAKTRDRNLYFISFLVLFIALLGSRSYGAFLGVLAGFVFYFAFNFKSWKKLGIMALTLALLASVFFYFQKDTEKFKVFFEYDQRSSSSVRLQTWQIAGTLISENPILGIGLGQFPLVYEARGEEILGVAPYEETQLHPHNIFLSFWLNMGILGLIFILGIIWKLFREVEVSKKYGVLFTALFLVVLVHGLVDQPFFKNDLSLLFWLLIGLIHED